MRKLIILSFAIFTVLRFFVIKVWAVDEFVQICGGQFCYKGQAIKLKGFNYWPINAPWASMWEESKWNEQIMSEELDAARVLGTNVIRINISLDHGWTDINQNVDSGRLDRLQRIIKIANSKGIKVIITLFDWYFDFNNWPKDWPQQPTSFDANNQGYVTSFTKTDNYVRTIVGRLKDEKGVIGWDIKNEPDGGNFWADNQSNSWKAPWVTYFLKRNRDLVKSIDQNHPVTIGSVNYEALFKQISIGQNQSYSIASLSEFISYHDYTSQIPAHATYVSQRINNSKPVLIEETGWPTRACVGSGWPDGLTDSSSYNEDTQVNRISSAFSAASSNNFSGVLIWELFDRQVGSGDECFGVLRSDKSYKLSADFIRSTNLIPSFSFEEVPFPTPTIIPPTATPTLTVSPTNVPTQIPTPTSIATVTVTLVPTPTNKPSSVINLKQGWNTFTWQTQYPLGKKFSDMPNSCSIMEAERAGYWRLYVGGYGGEDLEFNTGAYMVYCLQETSWQLI